MSKRSYNQHCAVAYALDLVGERWTLLLVRELLTGPKRYKELGENLPSMGTNLLASRLRDLQEAGLVEHADSLYALTPRGAGLEDVVLSLARFGAPLLGPRDSEEIWSATWNPVALKYAFRPDLAQATEVILEFRIDGHITQARVSGGEVETCSGSEWEPDASLVTDGETFLAISKGAVSLKDAETGGRLVIRGSRRALRSGLRAFGAA